MDPASGSLKMTMVVVLLSISCIVSSAQDFDFFYFVQQWPGAYCDTKFGCCYPKTGKPAVDFSIHGLWPNYNDGGYPSHCDNGSPFLPSEISDLRDEMEKQWPSLSCPSSDGTSFWSHEWERHGACSESVLDQHQYFQAALNLKTQLNLLHILTKAGKGWLSPYCQRSRAAAAGSDSNLCIRKHNFAAGPRKITSMSLGSKKIHAPYCTQVYAIKK